MSTTEVVCSGVTGEGKLRDLTADRPLKKKQLYKKKTNKKKNQKKIIKLGGGKPYHAVTLYHSLIRGIGRNGWPKSSTRGRNGFVGTPGCLERWPLRAELYLKENWGAKCENREVQRKTVPLFIERRGGLSLNEGKHKSKPRNRVRPEERRSSRQESGLPRSYTKGKGVYPWVAYTSTNRGAVGKSNFLAMAGVGGDSTYKTYSQEDRLGVKAAQYPDNWPEERWGCAKKESEERIRTIACTRRFRTWIGEGLVVGARPETN